MENSSLDGSRYKKSQCPDKNKTVACALRKSGCHVSRRSCYIGDQFYCATSWLLGAVEKKWFGGFCIESTFYPYPQELLIEHTLQYPFFGEMEDEQVSCLIGSQKPSSSLVSSIESLDARLFSYDPWLSNHMIQPR